MYSRQNDDVTLVMPVDEFELLLMALGYAAGAAHRDHDQHLFWRWIKLANSINRGNPQYRPYEIDDAAEAGVHALERE
jgi:hypothetical protein